MQQTVYAFPGQPALAIQTYWCPVQDKMEIECTGCTASVLDSLQMTMDQIGLVRLVSMYKTSMYRYCGVWMITGIEKLSESKAVISMIDMTEPTEESGW